MQFKDGKFDCGTCQFEKRCNCSTQVSECTMYRPIITYIPNNWKVIDTGICPHNRSVSGYGNKLPTRYLVNDGKRNRRMYAICWSNVASFYVRVLGKRIFIQDYRVHG
jgi:hypothetical protein